MKNSNLERSFKCRLGTWAEILMSAFEGASLSIAEHLGPCTYSPLLFQMCVQVSVCVGVCTRRMWLVVVGVGE